MSKFARLSWLALLFVCPNLILAAAPPPGEEVLEEFKFDREGPIIVPVTIRGKSYPFIVDTGCSGTVFDEELRPLLGRFCGSAKARTPHGETEVLFFEASLARVGRQPLTTGGSVAVSGLFRKMREEHGVKVWGFLGMEFLAVHVVRIDFDRGRIALLKAADSVHGHRLRLKKASNLRPLVEAQLVRGEPSEWFLIDLGYAGNSGRLRAETFRSLEKGGNLRRLDTASSLTAEGEKKVNVGRLSWLKVGPFEHVGLHFIQGLDGREHSLNLNFWARYQVTFDFPGNAVYLRKGSRHAVMDVLDGSGLTILLHKGRPIVVAVAQGSPAAKVGIRKGDEVAAIDRGPPGTNMIRLRKRLVGEGKTVHLVIRRAEDKIEVALRLDMAWRAAKNAR
jgi:hypothetical protein